MLTTRSRIGSAVLVLACGLVLACTDPGTDPQREEAATALTERCDEFVEILCLNTYQCGEVAEESRASMSDLFGATDEASCLEAMDGFLGAICTAGAQSVAAGRSRYDGVAMDACLEASRQSSCEAYFVSSGEDALPLGAVCAAFPFVAGVQAEGEMCTGDFECVDDGVCDEADDGAGVCVTIEAGDECMSDFDCDSDDLYCDNPGNDFATGDSAPGVCAPRATVGEPCDDLWACVDGLHCDDVNGFDPETGVRLPGECRERLGPGEPCDEEADCISFVCDVADFNEPGVCA